MKTEWWLVPTLMAGCIADEHRMGVGHNDLGVVAITWDRSDDQGNDVFVLRGLSSDNQERAAVRVTRGTVLMTANQHEQGSEIVASVDAAHTRVVSRETR